MSLELQILTLFAQNKVYYDTYKQVINEEDFSDQGRILFNQIAKYYNKDSSVDYVDLEVLKERITREYPKHKDILNQIVDRINTINISPANIEYDLVEFKRENLGLALASQLSNPKSNKEQLKENIATYVALLNSENLGMESKDQEKDIYKDIDIISFLEQEETEEHGKIAILPKTLNKYTKGGLRRGSHMILFGRPNAGKTLFIINAIYGWVRQGAKVLICCNEEPTRDLIMRFLTRLTDMSEEEILKDKSKAQEIAYNKGFDKAVFTGLSPGTPEEVEELINEHTPDVLVLDQILKMAMPRAKGEFDNLTKASTFVRNMSKQYNLLGVSVTQAGEAAEGKLNLRMDHIYQSLTAAQGDAELIVGIGNNEAFEEQGKRMITICKDKMGLGLCYFPCKVDVHHSKLISLE